MVSLPMFATIVIAIVALLYVFKPTEDFNPNNKWEIFGVVIASGIALFLLREVLWKLIG
jgi:hypothetical protein